jgi:hypothetical protein
MTTERELAKKVETVPASEWVKVPSVGYGEKTG